MKKKSATEKELPNKALKTKTKGQQKNSQKEKFIPIKISTDVSLSALTIAFFLIDLTVSEPNQIVNRIFRKNQSGEAPLIAEFLFDESGSLEGSRYFSNTQTLILKESSYVEKLKKLSEQKHKGLNFYSEVKGFSEEFAKDVAFDFESLKIRYQQRFQQSFKRSSEILSWCMFLEKLFKLNTAQNIISFAFALVKSADYLPDMKLIIKDIGKTYGKNWRWKIAWEIALTDEKVKTIAEAKRVVGENVYKQWMNECKKQATTRWYERKKHVENILKDSELLRTRLERKFTQ